jgi:hypothetical protein
VDDGEPRLLQHRGEWSAADMTRPAVQRFGGAIAAVRVEAVVVVLGHQGCDS